MSPVDSSSGALIAEGSYPLASFSIVPVFIHQLTEREEDMARLVIMASTGQERDDVDSDDEEPDILNRTGELSTRIPFSSQALFRTIRASKSYVTEVRFPCKYRLLNFHNSIHPA